LKYFLSFRIYEQLDLALKTEFALTVSSRLLRHWCFIFQFGGLEPVAILEIKIWWGHCGVGEKVGGAT